MFIWVDSTSYYGTPGKSVYWGPYDNDSQEYTYKCSGLILCGEIVMVQKNKKNTVC